VLPRDGLSLMPRCSTRDARRIESRDAPDRVTPHPAIDRWQPVAHEAKTLRRRLTRSIA
jgi:hypothetical protein